MVMNPDLFKAILSKQRSKGEAKGKQRGQIKLNAKDGRHSYFYPVYAPLMHTIFVRSIKSQGSTFLFEFSISLYQYRAVLACLFKRSGGFYQFSG